LREVFCLPSIAEDSERNEMHEAMVAFENNSKRISITGLQLLDELFIAERKQFRIGNAVAIIPEHCFLDTHDFVRLCTVYHAKEKKYNGEIILFGWDKMPFRQVLIKKGRYSRYLQQTAESLKPARNILFAPATSVSILNHFSRSISLT